MTSTRTTLGPLTTAFVPPTNCVAAINDYGDLGVTSTWAASCSPFRTDLYYVGHDPSCYPSKLAEFHFSGKWETETMPFYSPGVSCPEGFTTACSLSRTDDEWAKEHDLTSVQGDIWNQLWVGETAVGCCPSDYVCDESNVLQCTSAATAGQVLSGSGYDYRCSMTPITGTVTESTGTAAAVALRVQMILPGPTRTGSPPQPTEPPTSSGGHSSGSSNTNDNNAASIAIPIVGGIFILLVLALFWYVGWKYSPEEDRRKRNVFKLIIFGIHVSKMFRKR